MSMDTVRICLGCREEFGHSGRCQLCGYEDFDTMFIDDVNLMRTGGLDDDAS